MMAYPFVPPFSSLMRMEVGRLLLSPFSFPYLFGNGGEQTSSLGHPDRGRSQPFSPFRKDELGPSSRPHLLFLPGGMKTPFSWASFKKRSISLLPTAEISSRIVALGISSLFSPIPPFYLPTLPPCPLSTPTPSVHFLSSLLLSPLPNHLLVRFRPCHRSPFSGCFGGS